MPDRGTDRAVALSDRSAYPTLAQSRYLNQASLGLVGATAITAMHEHLDEVARHGNLRMSDADEVAFLDGLRDRASMLSGVAADRVAIVSGASELLGQAPWLFGPPAGSTVLLVETDFPAVTRPWLDQGTAARVRTVADLAGSDLTDDLIDAISDDTAVVAVSWVQYGTGTVVDVPRLRHATRAVGAKLLVDVTQGLGALPADVASWEADLVVSSGYKWLGGHGGVGLGFLGEGVVDRRPALAGWMGAPSPFAFDATRSDFANDARRFTASTMAYVSVVGLATAIDELTRLGPARVQEHAHRLRDRLLDAVEPRGWSAHRDRTDAAAAAHIVSLAHPHAAADLADQLRDRGIVCSGRAGRLRVSLAHYNDSSDVDALAAVLGDALSR